MSKRIQDIKVVIRLVGKLSIGSDKKLIILNDQPARGGAGRYASQLYEASEHYSSLISSVWMAKGKKIEYLGYRFEPKANYILPVFDNFQAYLSMLFPEVFRRSYYNFIKNAKKKGLPIHYSSQLVPPIQFDDRDIVTILDIHALEEFPKYPFNYYRTKSYLKAHNILTISHSENEKIASLSTNSDPVVIHPYVSDLFHPINKSVAKKLLNLPDEKKIVLSISSAQSRKNVKTILEVLDKLGDQFILLRVGARLNSETNFENVDDIALNAIYNAADVLLFPTLSEGFGYPLAEAMKCGLPIVSSDIPIVREVTEGAAVLTDPLSVKQLATSIKELVDNPTKVIEREIKRSSYFTLERFKLELSDYYKKIGVLDSLKQN